jgi:hypothetical protein
MSYPIWKVPEAGAGNGQSTGGVRMGEVELTSKKWKKLTIASGLMMVAGVATCAASDIENAGNGTVLTIVGFFGVGFLGLVVAKMGAWWSNG